MIASGTIAPALGPLHLQVSAIAGICNLTNIVGGDFCSEMIIVHKYTIKPREFKN